MFRTASDPAARRRPVLAGDKSKLYFNIDPAKYRISNPPNTDKPRGQTALNFALLIALLGFMLMIIKPGHPHMALSETRTTEAESSLKSSIPVQIQAINKKIEKLEDRIETLEKKTVEWLRKEEGFQKQKVISEIRSLSDRIRAIFHRENVKDESDGSVDRREDYALASGGAMVVHHSDPYFDGQPIWSSSVLGAHPHAVRILKPGSKDRGDCFEFNGRIGFVEIRLPTAVIPEAVTLEHLTQGDFFERVSAPKHCNVSGWLRKQPKSQFLLTEFIYDSMKSNVQTFNVSDSAASAIVDTVRLDFISNYGKLWYTCICRFRVHGRKPDSAFH